MTASFFSLVEDRIRQVEERMRDYSNGHHPDLQVALEHIFSSGGKRVRPTIVLLTGGMFNGDQDLMVTLAAAIELLHTATLVHDDFIDGAMMRRGIPTLNTQWSPAATVLAGDYIFARAAELAAATGEVAVMQIFAQTLSTIVGGEINQLFASRGLASREDYYKRIFAKTASLFEAAARTAAMLSTHDPKAIAAMKQYGYEIGMAFQIVDDILDFTGEQTTVGKPVASDMRQGLITLPAIYYLESHPGDPDMQAVIEGAYQDEAQIERLVAAIRGSGSIQQALAEAGDFVQRGVSAIQALPDCVERQALQDVADYITHRKI